eukprot:CAMPEP_0171182112 /NCGR_PEP_ID=MMETSP0790-20130122/14602_1 /TAXON_ID=2925 /ORGANISM="Alexandrium catenella, Strain OF101" /LENGTH=625 /DNA_ID=CAMNT_0011647061 /DNA_START=49 /DNA_END=1926 /DNA_ORIENTATION=-
MLGRGRQQPQIVQQSGPSMQDIETAMDQMMGQALEQCRAMYDSRIAALESMVEQQQVQLQQLQQLSVLDSRLSQLAHEVSSLHLDHTVVKDDGQAVFDCILSSALIPAAQLQARRQICQSLSAFCSLMESKEQRQAMEGLTSAKDVAHLCAASRAFLSARKVSADKPKAAKTVGDLDDDVFQELKDYEPPRPELDKWEKSVTVHTVIGSLKVEGMVSKTDVLKYTDVYKIFTQLGLTLDQFVDKFTRVQRSRTAEDLEEMSKTVLERFSLQRTEAKDVIGCRDLYRLLEIIGYPLQRFKSIINGSDEPEQPEAAQKLGGYKIRTQLGQGQNTACYLGEHVSDQTRVMIKWPAPRDELAVLKDIQRAAPKEGCLGVPKLLAHGDCQREPYFITEILGSPLTRLFTSLDAGAAAQRWTSLCVVGRLALRRLKALHDCGFVHCDISPDNIALGVSREQSNGSTQFGLYLVGLEHAQKYPGGRALGSEVGSTEWSSIRSADGGERLPEDDLESLGWVLMNGLLGDLPWFPWLTAAYKDWDSQWTRHQAVKQAQAAKARFLEGGYRAFSSRKLVKMPVELAGFIPACRGAQAGKPDYAALFALLGGGADAAGDAAEKEDVEQFTKLLAGL